ncbi:putative formyltetrahydrofolate deformylase [Taylorella asinigenitalis 14/45]|uniref:Formyltetrahydrofolate deformylase n=2 Tax=Taylorella asinigenitalis TaxID=84590 RepID=G4QCF9_TAYAM|nr:formyltetrahydrofolate deformylase [Taylorella asinigenitalis]AEP36089.1 Formyltetrahydrofolate deformylase [Taylorella asinigenitalis MCE3]CCG20085.1 putative formyltetrahydrofolate deformylase [Taylorella asinigenitalis 14/45]
MKHYILTLSCPDRTGIVHTVSGFLLNLGGNIIDSQQFGDYDSKTFFLRVHFSLENFDLETLREKFGGIATQYDMNWKIWDLEQKSNVLILVSKQGHCLNDLLFRTKSGNLPINIVGVVSNHRVFEKLSKSYGIPFYHLPVSKENRKEQEAEILRLVDELEVDLVVLARYMQILSNEMCEALSGKAINIHHSFLPSFKGAKPYHQAYARGVKIIGATAHYVTSDLDEGPIIEQEIEHVDHRHTAEDLVNVGSDIESLVLSRAVRSHIEHRILINGSKTVVFD